MRVVFITVVSLLSLFWAVASASDRDVVETKDGNKYRGVIIQQVPNESITIQLQDGSQIKLKTEDIKMISKETADQTPGFHMHDGFYLSMSAGFSYGGVGAKDCNAFPLIGDADFAGASFPFDFKIGVALPNSNLILHGDIVIEQMSPNVSSSNELLKTFLDALVNSIMMRMYGIGVTYYFMPSNIFVNATIGAAQFGVTVNKDNSINSDKTYYLIDKTGFGFRFKGGKEWWVSKNWGLGVSGFFGYCTVGGGTSSALFKSATGTYFGLMFNTTYN
jgi:hypothetical protein